MDLLKVDSHNHIEGFLLNNLTNGLKPFITKPTRITPNSKTLIDNIFSNILDNSHHTGNLICSISDHLPQILVVNHQNYKNIQNEVKEWRDYRKFNRVNFTLDYLSTTWENKLSNKNIDQQMQCFIETTNEVIERHAPLRRTTKKVKQPRKPWITRGLLKSIETKQKLFQIFLKAQTKEDKDMKFVTFKKINFFKHQSWILEHFFFIQFRMLVSKFILLLKVYFRLFVKHFKF